MLAMFIQQVQSMIESMQNSGSQILKMLPMLIAFKKGDTDGMLSAATGASGSSSTAKKEDKKSGGETESA